MTRCQFCPKIKEVKHRHACKRCIYNLENNNYVFVFKVEKIEYDGYCKKDDNLVKRGEYVIYSKNIKLYHALKKAPKQ